ncbi:DUF4397 domain-containing protein [Anaerolineales bacterium HSG24]|nr:DUF4397 domain-containing protein [Anaerolineales bacterium HSG24]
MKRLLIPFLGLIIGLLLVTAVSAQNESARLRAVHAVPDGSAITILIDGEAMFSELAYGDVADYLTIESGRYTVMIVSSTAPEMILYETEIELESDQDYSLISAGKLVLLESFLVKDANSLPATKNSLVRFIHLSPNAPTVDLLVKNGIEATLFSEVGFKDTTSYIPLEADSYEMTLRVAGTNVIALKQAEIVLEKGKNYTLFGVGLAGGEPALEISPHVEAKFDAPQLQTVATIEPSPTPAPTNTPTSAPTSTPTSTVKPVPKQTDMPAEESTTVEESAESAKPIIVQETSLTEVSSQAMAEANTSDWTILVPPPDLAPDSMPVTGIREAHIEAKSTEQADQKTMPQPMVVHPADETNLASATTQENSRLPLLFSLIVIIVGVVLGIRSVKEGQQGQPQRVVQKHTISKRPDRKQ